MFKNFAFFSLFAYIINRKEGIDMFPGQIRTGLTLPKVLGGIQKTLNVANQIIPLYVQAKPLIKNAQSAFQLAKEFIGPSSKNVEPIQVSKQPIKSIKKEEKFLSSSNPVFFQ